MDKHELRQKLESNADFILGAGIALQQLQVERNGHVILDNPVPMYTIGAQAPRESVVALIEAYQTSGLPLSQPVTVGKQESLRRCYYCGVFLEFETDGVTLRPSQPCQATEGVRIELDLAVPSGVIVVSDCLGPAFEAAAEDFDLSTAIGQAALSRAMADVGCAYGIIGNACPGVYRVHETHYVIATPGYDQNDKVSSPGERVAGIVTDLWAYSIADEASFLARGGDKDSWKPDRVELKPGVYHFVHHASRRGFDTGNRNIPTIFAEFKWVSPIEG